MACAKPTALAPIVRFLLLISSACHFVPAQRFFTASMLSTLAAAELAAHKLQIRRWAQHMQIHVRHLTNPRHQRQIENTTSSTSRVAPSAAILQRSQVRQLRSQIDQLHEDCIWLLCREPFDLMQAKLPREIRDMEYTYLFDATAMHIQHEHGACIACGDRKHATHNCPGCESFSRSCRDTPAKPFNNPFQPFSTTLHRLKDVRCVGAYTLTEMAETWYATTTFVVHVPQTIGLPLQSNLWGQNFEPRGLVRNVTVNIGWKSLADISYSYDNWGMVTPKLLYNPRPMRPSVSTLVELNTFTKQVSVQCISTSAAVLGRKRTRPLYIMVLQHTSNSSKSSVLAVTESTSQSRALTVTGRKLRQ